jgi:DNA-nicking Smr family endonuclease
MKKSKKTSPAETEKRRTDASTASRLGTFAEATDNLGDIKPLDRSKGPVVAPPTRGRFERKNFAPAERPSQHSTKPTLPRKKTQRQRGQPVSNRDLRSLRSGQTRPQLTVDLHGFTRDAARSRLCNAVTRACHSGIRCILVIHGKGHRSPGGEAVLKSALVQWIEEPPLVNQVAASCLAQARDGGSGASYLLLRTTGPGR